MVHLPRVCTLVEHNDRRSETRLLTKNLTLLTASHYTEDSPNDDRYVQSNFQFEVISRKLLRNLPIDLRHMQEQGQDAMNKIFKIESSKVIYAEW